TLTKMLESIEAEKFCSGHSEMTDRAAVKSHIAQMKEKQETIKRLLKQGKNLEQAKAEFEQAEGRLIESIYSEIEKQPR
ncbi:MAG: hypothetical protein AABZ02_13975, partial [Bacteroidota bacterium]